MKHNNVVAVAALTYAMGLATAYAWNLKSKPPAQADGLTSFLTVRDRILADHVGKPVTADQLYAGAIAGMVATLDDKFTHVLTPAGAEIQKEDRHGSYGDIGAAVTTDTVKKLAVISRVLPGSAAEKAQLKAGDILEAVDGKPVGLLPALDTQALIRGKVGEPVTLAVRRGNAEPFNVTVTREETKVTTVFYDMLEGRGNGILYVMVKQFGETTGQEFLAAVTEAKRSNARGILLDLRQNPGGLVGEAGKVACNWILEKPFVLMRSKDKPDEPQMCKGAAPLLGTPTVVLVDGQTASAAEITAAALQDNGARIIGTPTYGKGVGQIGITLFDGSELTLVTFDWLSPKGRSITGKGVSPDQLVTLPLGSIEKDIDEQMLAGIKHLNARH